MKHHQQQTTCAAELPGVLAQPKPAFMGHLFERLIHFWRRWSRGHSTLKFAVLAWMACIGCGAMAENASPLGLEVGVVTLTQVQKQIGSQTRLQSTGINKYSGGKMFEADASGLNVDGVKSVVFIFDQADVLAGLLVTMPKDPKSLVKTFNGKYKLVNNKVDNFMNYGTAQFAKGDTVIDIDAPHLSFDMEVRYLSKRLRDAFMQQSNAETAAKQKRKADSL